MFKLFSKLGGNCTSLKDPKYKDFSSVSIKKFQVVLYMFRRSYKHLLEIRSRFGKALAKLTSSNDYSRRPFTLIEFTYSYVNVTLE